MDLEVAVIAVGFAGEQRLDLRRARFLQRLLQRLLGLLDDVGVAFGPYPVNPSSIKDGAYRVWLDTEATDGDSKPPLLKPAEFAKLAKAVDAMKTVEIALVQDGADIARAAIPSPKRLEWRDALAAWAAATKPGVTTMTSCKGGDVVN